MVNQLKEILSNDVEVVIMSPQLSLSLLKCASVLLLNGGQPRACSKSQRNYYNKLKIQGMVRAEMIEKAKNRTCDPSFKGIRYSKVIMAHISSELLNDELAIEYLKKGALKESDFKVLPEGYESILNTTKVEEVEPSNTTKVEVPKKKRGRKPKNNK